MKHFAFSLGASSSLFWIVPGRWPSIRLHMPQNGPHKHLEITFVQTRTAWSSGILILQRNKEGTSKLYLNTVTNPAEMKKERTTVEGSFKKKPIQNPSLLPQV